MRRAPLLLLCLALAACGSGEKKKEGLGKAAADATNDTQVLGRVEAAANDVLRSPADCDAVKAAMPEAQRAFADAEGKLATIAGRQTLEALKAQVRSVSQNCP